MKILRNPWPAEIPYWKSVPKGGYQDLFFIARPERAQEFISVVEETAGRRSYPFDSIGIYKQPIEHNRACQLQFTFFYDPGSEASEAEVRALYRETFEALHSARRVLYPALRRHGAPPLRQSGILHHSSEKGQGFI